MHGEVATDRRVVKRHIAEICILSVDSKEEGIVREIEQISWEMAVAKNWTKL